ncbi:MAG: MarR family transcriptional regulator [Azospirillaceae bacterium]
MASIPAPEDRLVLLDFLPFRLYRLATEVSRELSRTYSRDFGIDIPEWRVIATLGNQEPAVAQAIAEATRMHKSTVSRAVAHLIETGWVERVPDRGDRRQLLLRLTDEGRARYARLVPVVLDYQARLVEALGPEASGDLLRALDRLEDALGLERRPGSADLESDAAD